MLNWWIKLYQAQNQSCTYPLERTESPSGDRAEKMHSETLISPGPLYVILNKEQKSSLETLYQLLNRDTACTGRLMASISVLQMVLPGLMITRKCFSVSLSQFTGKQMPLCWAFPLSFPRHSQLVNKCQAGTSHSAQLSKVTHTVLVRILSSHLLKHHKASWCAQGSAVAQGHRWGMPGLWVAEVTDVTVVGGWLLALDKGRGHRASGFSLETLIPSLDLEVKILQKSPPHPFPCLPTSEFSHLSPCGISHHLPSQTFSPPTAEYNGGEPKTRLGLGHVKTARKAEENPTRHFSISPHHIFPMLFHEHKHFTY